MIGVLTAMALFPVIMGVMRTSAPRPRRAERYRGRHER